MRARYDDGGPPDPPEHPSIAIVDEIMKSRELLRCHASENERRRTRQHWIGYMLEKLAKAHIDGEFRDSMHAVAVLAHGALEAEALGYFDPPPAPEEPY